MARDSQNKHASRRHYRISLNGASVDGSFGQGGVTPAVQLNPDQSGSCQKWTWNGASFLNNCSWTGHYLRDAGNGTVSEPSSTPDTWTVTASGSGWVIQDKRTKRYLSDTNGTLGMTTTETVWTIGEQ
jgi:hypothetical protein